MKNATKTTTTSTTTKKAAKKATTKRVEKPEVKALPEVLVSSVKVDETASAKVIAAAKAPTKREQVRKIELAEEAKAKAAATKPEAKKTTEAPELSVKLYGKGEFYFQRHAAARLGDAKFVAIELKGKTVTITPTTDKQATPVGYCHAAPVLRVAKLLADTGWSKADQKLVAKPVGSAGLSVVIA